MGVKSFYANVHSVCSVHSLILFTSIVNYFKLLTSNCLDMKLNSLHNAYIKCMVIILGSRQKRSKILPTDENNDTTLKVD